MEQVITAGGKFHADETVWAQIVFGDQEIFAFLLIHEYVARSLRHRRHRFTTRVFDIDFTITGFVLVPVTKVPCGPRETVIFT
jgi:hypothetical protein